jgi:hypothetical protein
MRQRGAQPGANTADHHYLAVEQLRHPSILA